MKFGSTYSIPLLNVKFLNVNKTTMNKRRMYGNGKTIMATVGLLDHRSTNERLPLASAKAQQIWCVFFLTKTTLKVFIIEFLVYIP